MFCTKCIDSNLTRAKFSKQFLHLKLKILHLKSVLANHNKTGTNISRLYVGVNSMEGKPLQIVNSKFSYQYYNLRWLDIIETTEKGDMFEGVFSMETGLLALHANPTTP